MIRHPARSTRTVTLSPYTTLVRSLLALAQTLLLMRGGEHVALLGSGLRPSASRATLTKIATLVQAGQPAADNLPPALPLPRSAQLVFVSDFLSPQIGRASCRERGCPYV